jgi:hypothetical protein
MEEKIEEDEEKMRQRKKEGYGKFGNTNRHTKSTMCEMVPEKLS